MREIITFNLKFLYTSINQNAWVRWFIEAAFVVVAVGLVSVLAKNADPVMPFGINAPDLTYVASAGVLIFVLALVFVSVIGIPLFRCTGILLMLAGIGVFEYQVYEYLKLGWWQPFPLRDFTDALFLTWTLDQSAGWPAVLLRNFCEQTSLSISLIGIGALWHALATKFLDRTLHDVRMFERETLVPDETLTEEQLAALSEPANADTFDDVATSVAKPIVLAEARLLRSKHAARDSAVSAPWQVDESRDTGAARIDSQRKPVGE